MILNSPGYSAVNSIFVNQGGTSIYSVQKDFVAIKDPGNRNTPFYVLPFVNITRIMSDEDLLKGQ